MQENGEVLMVAMSKATLSKQDSPVCVCGVWVWVCVSVCVCVRGSKRSDNQITATDLLKNKSI